MGDHCLTVFPIRVRLQRGRSPKPGAMTFSMLMGFAVQTAGMITSDCLNIVITIADCISESIFCMIL